MRLCEFLLEPLNCVLEFLDPRGNVRSRRRRASGIDTRDFYRCPSEDRDDGDEGGKVQNWPFLPLELRLRGCHKLNSTSRRAAVVTTAPGSRPAPACSGELRADHDEDPRDES